KSRIVIGTGIASLSTGCYGQMQGYRTKIFEMDIQPDGYLTLVLRTFTKIRLSAISFIRETLSEIPNPVFEKEDFYMVLNQLNYK
ncbi:MAG: hypothetical protein QME57_04250, partial [Patescibacteria group bacterium]|nr:hypothetical protein [Patescibacteria group bacterium]